MTKAKAPKTVSDLTVENLNTHALIRFWPGLKDEDRESLLTAVSTRGKWAGYVRANRKSGSDPAWNALVQNLAPVRVSIYSLLSDPDGQKVYDRLAQAIVATKLYQVLPSVEPEYRWSLYAHRVNVSLMRKAVVRGLQVHYNQKGA